MKTTQMKRKNSEIELYRFLMIIGVAILHFTEDYNGKIFYGGYLGVDFFFILSGYFLMIHFMRHYNDQINPIDQSVTYIASRLKRLYPPYLTACLLMILLQWKLQGGFKNLLLMIYQSKWQFLMLHSVGAPTISIVRSLWFISPLVVLSYLLYFMLCYKKQFVVGLAPIISILCFAFIAQKYGFLGMQFTYNGFLVGGFIRGLPEMLLGIFMAYYIEEYSKQVSHKTYKLWALICFRIVWYLMLLYVMMKSVWDFEDFSAFIPMVILIYTSFVHPINLGRIVEAICQYLGSISYWIYVLHIVVGYFIATYFPGHSCSKMILVYLLITILCSTGFDLLFKKILKKF